MNYYGGGSTDTPAACFRSGTLFVFVDGYCFLLFFASSMIAIFSRKNAHPLVTFSIPHMCPGRPVAFVCVRVLMFALRAFHYYSFFPLFPRLLFKFPIPLFKSSMRAQSFLLAFLLIVMSFCKSLLSGLMRDRRADQGLCRQCP